MNIRIVIKMRIFSNMNIWQLHTSSVYKISTESHHAYCFWSDNSLFVFVFGHWKKPNIYIWPTTKIIIQYISNLYEVEVILLAWLILSTHISKLLMINLC